MAHSDPFQLLAADHAAIRALTLAWAATTEACIKADVARRLVALVAAHAELEATHVHPLYVPTLGRAGVAMLSEATEGDADIAQLCHALLHDVDWRRAEADPAHGVGQLAKANDLFQSLAAAIREHTGSEEDHWFPALGAKMAAEDKASLLARLQAASAAAKGGEGAVQAAVHVGQPQQPSAQ